MHSSRRRPSGSRVRALAAAWTLLVAPAAFAQLPAAVPVPWMDVACPRPPTAAGAGGIRVVEIEAGRCNIALVAAGSPAAAGPGVVQLAAVSRINASLDTDLRPIRLPLTVQLSNASAPPEVALRLAVPQGGEVTLRDLYLGDVTLESPTAGDLNKVLLPVSIDLPIGAQLHLENVILEVSEQQLVEYVDFMRGVPYAPVWTDNTTFLFIGNYTQPPTGVVDAQSVLLVAPTAASYQGQRLTRTQAALAAVTDSYVLGTDNFSTSDWMRTFGGVSTPAPAFIYVVGNVSLSPRYDATWPRNGIAIERPLVLAGSYWRPTSVDLGMTAGQFVIQPPHGNVTLMNLWLENLGLGDAASAAISGGNSIVLQNQLWAFSYLREEPRLVVRNVVEVLPQDQIDNIIYWANAFNSPTEFWRNNTRFLRDTLRYTVLRFQRGQVPGEFIIQQALKKDQLMYNVTYTTRNLAAKPLPLNYDPAAIGGLSTSAASPATGLVHNVSDMQFAIWNQQQGQCNRQHVLVFANDVDLSPETDLPLPDAVSSDAYNGTAELRQLSVWPPPGGLLVECPVQLVGGLLTPDANAAAASGGLHGRRIALRLRYQNIPLFRVEQPPERGPDDVLPSGPLLGFKDVRMTGLRQSVTTNTTKPLSAVEAAMGAWVFPLWWLNRTFDSNEPASVGLVNVTLVVPGPEFEALARQVAAGPDFVLPTTQQAAAAGGRKLLQQAATGPSGPSVTFRNAQRVVSDRICVSQLSGLGLNGSDVCMVPDPAPLPFDYLPPDAVVGFGTASRQSTWPAWKYVLAIVLPVLAAAALAGVLLWWCCKRRRQRKQLAAASRKSLSSQQYILFGGEGGTGSPGGYHPGSGDGSNGGVVGRVSPLPTTYLRSPSAAGSASGSAAASAAGASRRVSAAGVGSDGFPVSSSSPQLSAAGGSTGDLELTAQPPQQQQQRVSYEAVSTLGEPPIGWASHTPGIPPAGGRGAAGGSSPGGAMAGGRGRRLSGLTQLSSGSSSRPSGATSSTWQRLSTAIHTVSREMQMKRLESAFNMAAAAGMLKGAGAGAEGVPGADGVSGGILPAGRKGATASGGGSTSPLSGRVSGVLPVGSGGAGSSAKHSPSAAPTSPQQQQQQQQQAVGNNPLPAGGQSLQGALQQQLNRRSANMVSGRASSKQQLQLHEPIGKGTFGVVYRATWRGIPAAVKVMQLSAAAWSGQQTSVREQMAVMEAVLSSTLSHPNTVQVYTYMLRPVSRMQSAAAAASAQRPSLDAYDTSSSSLAGVDSSEGGGGGVTEVVVAWELLLVMEYCELGSLRQAITEGLLDDRVTGLPHYPTILSLALDIANAMLHLHSEGVVHGDLKAGNVLLRSAAGGQRRSAVSAGAAAGGGGLLGAGSSGPWPGQEVLQAKVADFGLASQLQEQDTHISGVHRGTLTHMAPELLLHRRASKASDVYAFAILLWELYTARRAFQGVPKVLLGHLVCESRQRPAWAGDVPPDYKQLVETCWAHEAGSRPSFEDICCQLEGMLENEDSMRAQLAARVGITSSDAAAAQEAVIAAAGDAAVGRAGSDSTAKEAGAGGSSSPSPSSEGLVTAEAGSRIPSITSSGPGGISSGEPAPPAAAAAATTPADATALGGTGVVGPSGTAAAVAPAAPAAARPPARAYVSPFAAVQHSPEGGGP